MAQECECSCGVKLAYSISEAAAATGLHESDIRRAIARGQLTPSTPGRRPVIVRNELERWLAGAAATAGGAVLALASGAAAA